MANVRKTLLILSLTVACATAAVGQNLPDLGDASAGVLSPQLERKIGEEAFRDIRSGNPLFLDDPEITNYVSELGARLTGASSEARQKFEFFVLRDPSINAFAMPGGYVGVHTGLLLAAQSESEIASVLAHEISHVTQHHIARMVTRGSQISSLSIAATILALLAARSNPDMAQAAMISATAGSIQAQLDFSREFEREADRLGFQLLRDAGFDVHAMPNFFERLQRAGRFYDNSAPSYLRTHPLTTERISDMQNRAQSLPYKQVPDGLDFYLVRAKLRAEQGLPREALAAAESQVKDRRYASQAGARYGLVVALMRSREFVRAEREMVELRKLTQPDPMVELLAARLRTVRGDPAGALDVLQSARRAFALDRAVAYALVEALQSLGRHQEALAQSDSLIQAYPTDARLFAMRARSLAATGKSLQLHQALAEQYYLSGSLPAAIEQLQLAQKAGEGDFYQQSVLEARLRQMRAEMGDRAKLR